MFQNLIVRLSKKQDPTNTLDLTFALQKSNFLPKWINRMLVAQQRQDPISEPWAFYHLNNQWSEEYTIKFINENINRCNEIFPGMFERTVIDIQNQDDLNYIHSVFELYHGQLDTWKTNSIFDNIHGDELRNCLSHINQTVHRCEGASIKHPKLRVVYFDLPKTETFTSEDYQEFTNKVEFGGLYTLYADVGKNLESLATDNDNHHHDFVPNLHYSADFTIKFWDNTGVERENLCKQYIEQHKDYFISKGYTLDDPRLTTGSIKLGQLIYKDKSSMLESIQPYDNIQSAFLF